MVACWVSSSADYFRVSLQGVYFLMLKWLNIKEFMNHPDEWHAFVEGFNETFCFWKERILIEGELLESLHCEHHYYTTGRVLGFVCLCLFGVGIYKLIRRRKREHKRSD